MQALTFDQLITTSVVILVLVGAYNTIMTAVKTRREEKKLKEKPVNDITTIIEQHEKKLDNDNDRLVHMEEANRVMLRGVMALLSHEINGNSVDKLKTSYDEIQQFLIEK